MPIRPRYSVGHTEAPDIVPFDERDVPHAHTGDIGNGVEVVEQHEFGPGEYTPGVSPRSRARGPVVWAAANTTVRATIG